MGCASGATVEAVTGGASRVTTGSSAIRASPGELATFAGAGGGTDRESDSQQQQTASGPQQHVAEPISVPGQPCAAGAGTGPSTSDSPTSNEAHFIR
jgi:hypothetical protein